MSKRAKVVAVLLSLFALASALPAAQVVAATSTVLLTPASQAIGIGQSATVTLRAENVESLYGYQVQL
ncbi:MAG TPA: hypothetical protein VM366_20595, partial [Anaerolineae bacterium]|nr:hypothetical protein [Anaerolineae bacterium]